MIAVLDRAHFDHMTSADRALQAEILGLFRMQTDGWSAALVAAQGWREALHTLKGSARGIGLHRLAAACESAEVISPEQRAKALTSVRAALDEALVALEYFTADAAR